MERTALTEPLKTGFRRIFFRQTEQGEERLSVVKVILFVAYLLANLLAYFQFATLTNPIPQLRSEATGTSVLDYQIPRTSYGELALFLNFLVFVGAVFFFLTQDKPLSVWVRPIRGWASQSRLHLIGLSVGGLSVGVVSVLQVRPLLQLGLAPFAMGVSYYLGLALTVIWWILQPILFFGGSLLLIDTLTHEEQFQNWFGHLTKPRRRTAELLILETGILVIIFVFAATVFNVTLGAATPELGLVTPVAGVEFYQISIYHLLNILKYLIVFTGLNLLVLGVVHVWKKARALPVLILGILFMGFLFLRLTNRYEQVDMNYLLIAMFIGALLLVYLLPVRYILKRALDPDYVNSRVVLLPWILFAGIFLAVLKTIPVLLATTGRLTALSNWLDGLGLFFALLLGIIRVTTITERLEPIVVRAHSRNPLKWVKRIRIPPYSKILALFYLAFIGYYLSLETHTIALSLTVPNDFKMLRLEVLPFTSSFVFVWVFWRYKPLTRTTTATTEQVQR